MNAIVVEGHGCTLRTGQSVAARWRFSDAPAQPLAVRLVVLIWGTTWHAIVYQLAAQQP
jgi:hypothetical protein